MKEIEQSTQKSRLIMLCAGIALLGVLAVLCFVVRPNVVKPKAPNKSGIIKFSFERAKPDGSSVRLNMSRKEGAVNVVMYDSELGGVREHQTGLNVMENLQALMEESGVCDLDRYYERGPVIGNENSFSLTVSYVNGQDIAASGVTVLPKNIDEITQKLIVFFSEALFE